jgi:hypothetical protein
MSMLLLLLTGRQVVEETEPVIKAGVKKIVGSFEKAVPVIFKPRGVRRPLFPWLLTGLHSFRSASERADNGRRSNAGAKHAAGRGQEFRRCWPVGEVEYDGNAVSPKKARRKDTNYETGNATAEHLNTSYACSLRLLFHKGGEWGVLQ